MAYYVFDDAKNKIEGMSREQIISAIAQATGHTPAEIDADAIMTAIKEQNAQKSVNLWIGTQNEYNAIQQPDENTLYCVTDPHETNELQNRINQLQAEIDTLVAVNTSNASGVKIETTTATEHVQQNDDFTHSFELPAGSVIVEAMWKTSIGSAWNRDGISISEQENGTNKTITLTVYLEDGHWVGSYQFKLIYSYPDTVDLSELTDIRVGYNGTVYGSAGEAVRKQAFDTRFHDYIKQALLNLLSHVAFIDGNGQQYYNALERAMYMTAGVTSITAVFDQGENVIYDTDDLDTLRQYLTVTARYEDNTSEVITDYTLSGTLEAGTSTITVSYMGKTATFEVTVTTSVLYSVEDYAFNMTAINTEQQLCEVDRDWSVAYDVTLTSNPSTGNGSNFVLFGVGNEVASDGYAVAFKKAANSPTKFTIIYYGGYQEETMLGTVGEGRHRFVITHKAGSNKVDIAYRKDNGSVERVSRNGTYDYSSKTIRLGVGSTDRVLPTGTLNSVVVYAAVLSSAKIDEFLGLGGA